MIEREREIEGVIERERESEKDIGNIIICRETIHFIIQLYLEALLKMEVLSI